MFDYKMIIPILLIIIYVWMLGSAKLWLGTKLGDFLIIVIGVSTLYGMITASINIYEWLIK